MLLIYLFKRFLQNELFKKEKKILLRENQGVTFQYLTLKDDGYVGFRGNKKGKIINYDTIGYGSLPSIKRFGSLNN